MPLLGVFKKYNVLRGHYICYNGDMELVHVLSRGVDKRKIFLDDQDNLRFIHDLFEFNDQELVNNNFYRFLERQNNIPVEQKARLKRTPRKLLVDIHAFCLMPNHYHLLLSTRVENGISKFMQKLNAGYVLYFNERYERKGTLFEGRYKSVSIKNDAHFIHLPYYIHLNPLDLFAPEWRKRELKDYKKAFIFLNSYRWSSHMDYAGMDNFPSVTQRDFLLKFFGGSNKYKNSMTKWIKDLDLEELGRLKLE